MNAKYEMLKGEPEWDVYILGKDGKFYLLVLDTPMTTIAEYETFFDANIAMDNEVDRQKWNYQ